MLLELNMKNNYFVADKNHCRKCGRSQDMGICDGCGEYATLSKCECERLPNKQDWEDEQNRLWNKVL